ncbi:MAG: radical SAM protein [bacterium]
MRILLVYPRTRYPSGDIPIGLSLLGAVLRKHGCEVELFDLSFKKNWRAAFAKTLHSKKYDFMGMSLMTTMVETAAALCRAARDALPEMKIIAGGPHPTVLPEQTLKDTGADVCVVGEGERVMPAVASGAVDAAPGTAAVRNGTFVLSPPAEPIPDLDSLPFPDFSLFDVKKYTSCWFSLDSVSPRSRGMNIIATRGCPFRCTFCQPTLTRLFGRTIRKHSPAYVSELVGALRNAHDINCFMFEDDTFTADRKWCMSVAETLSKNHPGIYWGCNTHVRLADEALLRELKKGGLRKIFIGIESASRRILSEIYEKDFTPEEAREKITIAKRLGLKIQAYFMIGAPTETEKEIAATIRFAVSSPLDEASFNIATPLPGTVLHQRFLPHIRVNTSRMNYYDTPPFDEKIALHPRRLAALKKLAVLKFYASGRRPAALARGLSPPAGFRRFLLKIRRF